LADSGPLTQDQAFGLLQRTSDPSWLASELAGPDGTAVLNARTAIAEATSQAVQSQAAACTISDAPGGNAGTCLLTVSRNDASASIPLPAGYRFVTGEGIDLVLQSTVVIAIGAGTVTLPLQTLRQTELVNTYDPAFDSLVAAGALMPTSNDSPAVFDSASVQVLGPGTPDTDSALHYVSSTMIEGAASDWLSVHGDERGSHREPSDSTEEYRARIRAIPDVVSLLAISAAVNGAASNVGLGQVTTVETLNPGCSDDMMTANDLAFQDTACEGDFFDDPIGVDLVAKLPERSLEMVGRREGRAYFRLDVTGPMREPDGSVTYYDAAFFDDPAWGFPDFQNPRVVGALLTVQRQADIKKAGGVNALASGPGTATDLFVEDRLVIPPPGSTAMAPLAVPAGTEATAWILHSDPLATPGSETKAWLLRDALASTSSQIQPVKASGQIGFSVLEQMTNNDYVTITDGAGGFITIEVKVDGTFVPTPGRLTADVSGTPPGDAVTTGRVIVAIINASSAIREYRESSSGPTNFEASWYYPVTGVIGDVPIVVFSAVSGALTASGFSGGVDPTSPGTVEHRLQFTFSDATTFTTQYWDSGDSEHLTIARLEEIGFPFKPIVQIEAFLNNVGASDVMGVVCGTFWAVESALP